MVQNQITMDTTKFSTRNSDTNWFVKSSIVYWLLKFHSSHMTISVIQLESANTMYFEVTVRWVIKSNPSSLALLTLNFVCCLILGDWWVSESFHQSPPRVTSPPAHIILPLQPSSQHVVEEGWWVLHDIQSGNCTESQHQSQSKDLILLQVH